MIMRKIYDINKYKSQFAQQTWLELYGYNE